MEILVPRRWQAVERRAVALAACGVLAAMLLTVPFWRGADAGSGHPPLATRPSRVPPPLPGDCSSLAEPGEEPPAACVFGYVLVDGLAVAGAPVVVGSNTISITLTTAVGPASPEPYFGADLSNSALQAEAGDILQVAAQHGTETGRTTFMVLNGSQQVDVWLSSLCGPSYVPGLPITGNVTWQRACSPYIVQGNPLVIDGALLEIEPGTTVQFDQGRALTVDGALWAVGSPNALVAFTANAIGQPAPGHWGYIQLRNDDTPPGAGDPVTNTLSYALVEYAGGLGIEDNGAIRVNGDHTQITHSTIRRNASDGIHAFNGGAPLISTSQISDNDGWGVYAQNGTTTPISVTVTLNHITENADGGVYVDHSRAAWVTDNLIAGNGDGAGVEVRFLEFEADIANNTILGNRGGIRIDVTTGFINHNLIHGNTGRGYGGGLYVNNVPWLVLNDNVFLENQSTYRGGAVYVTGGQVAINENVFVGNQTAGRGGAIDVATCRPLSWISHSAFYDNHSDGHGGAIFASDADLQVQRNTVVDNSAGSQSGGVFVDDYPVFDHNNLYGNAAHDLYNGNLEGAPNFLARNNWWLVSDYVSISNRVYDFFDDGTLGIVDFDNWLVDYETDAPITPPTGFTAAISDTAATLTWNANPEPDAAGYKVYYDPDPHGLLYYGTGADQGDAPIDVGQVVSVTLTGLAPGTYRMTVTAYDDDLDGEDDQTDGNESWFSHEVLVDLSGCTMPGDVNCDGVVDVLDIQAVAGAWYVEPVDPRFDLDQNGVVDIRDVMIVAGLWNPS